MKFCLPLLEYGAKKVVTRLDHAELNAKNWFSSNKQILCSKLGLKIFK